MIDTPIASPEELAARLVNLTLALSVAFVARSVAIIEHELRSGSITTDRLAQLLDDEIAANSEAHEEYTRSFGTAMEAELRSAFGYDAGRLIWSNLAAPQESRPVAAMVGRARSMSGSIHLPLNHYIATYDEWRYRHARLIQAIATEGMESITAFRFVEKHEDARGRLGAALRDVTRKFS